MKRLLPIFLLALTGCSLFPNRLKIGDNIVTPQKDVSTATLSTFNQGEAMKLAAGSRIVMTKFKAMAGVPATKDSPAVPAQPEREVTEIFPAGDTEWHKTEATVAANSGVVDTTIRAKQIEAAESRPLLWAALGCLAGAAFFIWAKYPTPALCCGAGAVVLFLAWKLSDLPAWFYVVGILAAGAGVFLYLGHEKGERHAALTVPNSPEPK